MKKILHLTLHKKWFDAIKSGEKTTEYRKQKPYWDIRLFGKDYDEVHFRNGYREDCPFMRVECLGIVKVGNMYHIKLGKVLEVTP